MQVPEFLKRFQGSCKNSCSRKRSLLILLKIISVSWEIANPVHEFSGFRQHLLQYSLCNPEGFGVGIMKAELAFLAFSQMHLCQALNSNKGVLCTYSCLWFSCTGICSQTVWKESNVKVSGYHLTLSFWLQWTMIADLHRSSLQQSVIQLGQEITFTSYQFHLQYRWSHFAFLDLLSLQPWPGKATTK